MRFSRREPVAPVNLRLIDSLGRVIPLDCVYLGRRRGIHQWRAVTEAKVYGNFTIEADMIPGRTSIEAEVVTEVSL